MVNGFALRILFVDDIRVDRGELQRLIEAGFAGIEPDGIEVRVERAARSRDSFTGRAYPEPPRRPTAHPATQYLIRLKIPGSLRNRGYPKSYRYPRRKTAPWIVVHDWRERFIALVAHEAFHVRQFREGLRRSEVAAERWAVEVLLRTRAGNGSSSEKDGLRPKGQTGPVQMALFELGRGGIAWHDL